MNPRSNQWPSISCVLPAYNEANNLVHVIPQLVLHLQKITTPFEIIIVNDGSKDNTIEIANHLCLEHQQVVFISLSRNFGKEAALAAGIENSSGDVTILLDADGQHPFELINEMLAKWQTGSDVVYAIRKTRDDQGQIQIGLTGLFYQLVNLGSKIKIPANAGDFRLMDRAVVEALRQLPEKNRFMKGLYAWVGFQSTALEYEPLERLSGKSQFGFMGSLRLALTGLLAFSTLPLKLLTFSGVFLSLIAISYGIYEIIINQIRGVDVPGYSTIVVSIMFFSGVQLIATGIIASYIGRIYEEVKQRPLYLVKQHTGLGLQKNKSESF